MDNSRPGAPLSRTPNIGVHPLLDAWEALGEGPFVGLLPNNHRPYVLPFLQWPHLLVEASLLEVDFTIWMLGAMCT